jgi:hypothetical protein
MYTAIILLLAAATLVVAAFWMINRRRTQPSPEEANRLVQEAHIIRQRRLTDDG